MKIMNSNSFSSLFKGISILLIIFSLTGMNSGTEDQKYISAQDDWKLAKSKNGIKVYLRKLPGKSVKQFKAVTNINCKIEDIEKILDDVKNYPKWQANTSTASLLKKVSDTKAYEYFTIELSWPLDDRDIVSVKTKTVSEDKKTIIYRHKCVPDYIPEKKDYLRLKEAEGFWQVKEIGENKISVIYQYYGEPGGSLPGWLVNMFIVDGPVETLTNLKEMLQ